MFYISSQNLLTTGGVMVTIETFVLPVIDQTGTRTMPASAHFRVGARLNGSDIRATALNALRLKDIPHVAVEVLGENGKPTTRISKSCVLIVRLTDTAPEYDEIGKLIEEFNDLLKSVRPSSKR